MLPIPFIIDGEIKNILLYINIENNTNNRFNFAVYDNNEEICQISISNDNKYLITISFFDEKLYNRCISIKEKMQEDLKKIDDIMLDINYFRV